MKCLICTHFMVLTKGIMSCPCCKWTPYPQEEKDASPTNKPSG